MVSAADAWTCWRNRRIPIGTGKLTLAVANASEYDGNVDLLRMRAGNGAGLSTARTFNALESLGSVSPAARS
jgi:hypothetical protein